MLKMYIKFRFRRLKNSIEAVLTSNHDLCFGAKIRKIGASVLLHTRSTIVIEGMRKFEYMLTRKRSSIYSINIQGFLAVLYFIDFQKSTVNRQILNVTH